MSTQPPYYPFATQPSLASDGHHPAESGFHIVQRRMSREDLERVLYGSPPSETQLLTFDALNKHLGEWVRPGQMVLFSDPRYAMCRREEAQMMEAAKKVDETLRHMTDEEASFMVEHHEVIESFLEVSAGSLGVASFMVGMHLDNLKTDLRGLEALHQQQYRQFGHLHSPEFLARREQLLTRLDHRLGPLVRKGVGIPTHPRLELIHALGLSDRRTLHHWNKAGAPGRLPGYATNITGVAKAAKYMKAGGYLGIGLGMGASSLKIHEVCTTGQEEECRKVKFTEGGKIVGMVTGAVAGGYIGNKVGTTVCAGVKGLGQLACALIVGVTGATYVGTEFTKGGEEMGEVIYEGSP